MSQQLYNSHIEFLHVELTNRCNARCPMCSRTGNPVIEDDPADISIDKFRQMFPIGFISKLKAIIFCGNFGDPAAAKDCVEIHEYVLAANPNITFFMHTNGGTRSESFWKALGDVYSRAKGFIGFHIDGLEDTNQRYRVDVDFNRTMRNAEIAIAAGAKCNWMFIPFEYNQHQIAQAQQLAKEKGFYKFVQILTARFGPEPQPLVWFDRRTNSNKALYPTTLPELQLIKQPALTSKPRCRASILNELFVSARGIAMPCCWLSSSYEQDPSFRANVVADADPDITTRSVNEVLDDPLFLESIPQYWKTDNYVSRICNSRCTKSTPTQEWLIDGERISEDNLTDWLSTI